MDTLQIFLLGKFQARFREETLSDLDALKVQELFSYLLLIEINLTTAKLLVLCYGG